MRAKEFIIEQSNVQENPDYGLPSLDKHNYSVIDKLVRDKHQEQKITAKAAQELDEDDLVDDSRKEEVLKFVKWACKVLNISSVPEVELSMDSDEAQNNHHTGGHVPGSGTIWVYSKNRNLVDVLRTAFHELVHVRQHELNMIKPGSSYPGSPIEAMADILAGKYIKIYGKKNHHIFENNSSNTFVK